MPLRQGTAASAPSVSASAPAPAPAPVPALVSVPAPASALTPASTSMAPSADDSRLRRKRSPSTSTDYRSVENRRSDNKVRKVSPSDTQVDVIMTDAQPSSVPPPTVRARQHSQEHSVPIALPPRPEASVVRDRSTSAADEQTSSLTWRYFVIKSANSENVHRSQRDGVWATQEMNAKKLSEAFQTAKRGVILIFSINGSQHFQGYAKMCSGMGAVKYDKWTSISESSLGGTFRVKWLKIAKLPFERTNNIRNSWNDDLPVKRSRDGQELPPSVGAMLCRMFDEIPEGGYPETIAMNNERAARESYQAIGTRSRVAESGGGSDEERTIRTPRVDRQVMDGRVQPPMDVFDSVNRRRQLVDPYQLREYQQRAFQESYIMQGHFLRLPFIGQHYYHPYSPPTGREEDYDGNSRGRRH